MGENMTLRHIKIFVTVCECESITMAAQKLYLAQPAVSLAISELEKYYGIKLFDRISRRLYITEAGKQFLSYAVHIVNLFDEMENKVKNWESVGTLRVGSSITIGNYLMPLYVKQFSKLYPSIIVNVLIDNSQTIEDKILSNELDFALIEGIVHSTYITSENYLDDKLVLICGEEHPFFRRSKISLEEMKNEKFLLREKGSGTREVFDSTMESKGISIIPVWESTSTRAIINAVIEGIGISVLPLQLIQHELGQKKIKIVPIKGIEFKRNFSIIYHKNKYLTQSVLAFMNLCREMK